MKNQATRKQVVTPLKHTMLGDIIGALVVVILGCLLTSLFIYIG